MGTAFKELLGATTRWIEMVELARRGGGKVSARKAMAAVERDIINIICGAWQQYGISADDSEQNVSSKVGDRYGRQFLTYTTVKLVRKLGDEGYIDTRVGNMIEEAVKWKDFSCFVYAMELTEIITLEMVTPTYFHIMMPPSVTMKGLESFESWRIEAVRQAIYQYAKVLEMNSSNERIEMALSMFNYSFGMVGAWCYLVNMAKEFRDKYYKSIIEGVVESDDRLNFAGYTFDQLEKFSMTNEGSTLSKFIASVNMAEEFMVVVESDDRLNFAGYTIDQLKKFSMTNEGSTSKFIASVNMAEEFRVVVESSDERLSKFGRFAIGRAKMMEKFSKNKGIVEMATTTLNPFETLKDQLTKDEEEEEDCVKIDIAECPPTDEVAGGDNTHWWKYANSCVQALAKPKIAFLFSTATMQNIYQLITSGAVSTGKGKTLLIMNYAAFMMLLYGLHVPRGAGGHVALAGGVLLASMGYLFTMSYAF